MDNKSDSGILIFFGGVIAVVAIGNLALQAIQALFIQIGHAFNAFGKMALSFGSMLWGVGQMAVIVVLIVGSIVAAVYFTYRYVKLVRAATDLDKRFQDLSVGLAATLQGDYKKFRAQIIETVHSMDDRLTEALNKPEPTPALAPTSPQATETGAQLIAGTQNSDTSQETQIASMNPY